VNTTAGVLHYTSPESLAKDKHYSLLANLLVRQSVVNTKPGPYSQHFIFPAIFEWAQYARVLHYTSPESLAKDKHYSLLGQFVS
jgi:hypothetical protein